VHGLLIVKKRSEFYFGAVYLWSAFFSFSGGTMTGQIRNRIFSDL
jgi:hypothetical protein